MWWANVELENRVSITVMRKVQFCAGHRLLGHEGKCANLHGHNYLVEFHVTGKEVDELGRVVDFAVINRLFKGWIDDHWGSWLHCLGPRRKCDQCSGASSAQQDLSAAVQSDR